MARSSDHLRTHSCFLHFSRECFLTTIWRCATAGRIGKPLRTLFAPPGSAAPVTPPTAEIASTEQLMWSGRPSHWNFLFSWLLAFLFVGTGAFCVWIYFNGGNSPLLLVPGAIGVLILLYIYISRARQRYIVTNRKVEIQTGLVVKSSNEIRVNVTTATRPAL